MASDATRPIPPPGLVIQWDNAPPELTSRRIWCLWRAVAKDGEKPRKVPWRIDGSSPLRWSNSLNLSSFEEVKAAYLAGATLPEHSGNHFAGIGIVIPEKGDLKAFDLDEAIENSQIKPAAKAILDRINTYSETSPSGKGYHGIAFATLPEGSENLGEAKNEPLRIDGQRIEFYAHSHFLTFTGHRLPEYPASVETRNEEMQGLYEELRDIRDFVKAASKTTKPANGGASDLNRARIYCLGALGSEVRDVAGSSEGARNNRLNEAALKIGHYVGAGILSRSGVENELLRAALDAGLSESESRATIRSGLEAGISEPKNPPLDIDRSQRVQYPNNHDESTDPLSLNDVANIEYNANGHIKNVRLSPTKSASAVLGTLPLAMSEDSQDIYRYNGQIYKPDGVRIVDMTLCDLAGDAVTKKALDETLRRVKNALIETPVTFEPDPYLLPVKNGIANLVTGQVRGYSPEDLMLDQIQVNYDPEAKCPAFLRFLETSAPNITDRITLIDWFVATAIREPLPYALFLLGLGRNGKGIYERLLKRFFGAHNFRDMDLEEVVKNNFARSHFYRVRGWVASETGKKKKPVLGTDFVKMTSGNGVIDADRKNQSRIQFEPYFQTIVDTNLMPKIDDNSRGWMERFIKVDLPYVFVAHPDPANPLEKTRDPDLFHKLTTPGELSGILNLLLFRAKEIGKSCTIHKRPSDEMFAEYAEQSSSVNTFIDQFLEYDPRSIDVRIPTSEIYRAYQEWCDYKVGEKVADSYFGRHLRKLCNRDPERPKRDGKDVTVYPGLLFYKGKLESALSELKKKRGVPVSEASSEAFGSNRKHFGSTYEANTCQQLTISEASEANMWNQIIILFGEVCMKENTHMAGDSMSGEITKNASDAYVPPKAGIVDLSEGECASEVLTNVPTKSLSSEAIVLPPMPPSVPTNRPDENQSEVDGMSGEITKNASDAYVPPNSIEVELEEAKARVSEKEAHFVEEAAKRTSQGQSSDDNGLSDRAILQKVVKETAARCEKEGRPISLFRLAETIGAKDMDAVSAILMMAGYKQTDDRDDKGFKIWKKTDAPPDGAGA